MSISNFKVTDTTETTTWSRTSSTSMGERTRRQRSFTDMDHNGSPLKKNKKPKKKEINYDHNNGTLFVQKTYDMISTCDTKLCEWSSNGDMFIVKDKDQFAMDVIPEYFEHSNFASFARQLNIYGFRKVKAQPLRKADIDEREANYEKFSHENFKRDKKELLREIHRSKRGGANTDNSQEQQYQNECLEEEIVAYKGEVMKLTDRVIYLENKFGHIEKQLGQLLNSRSMKCKFKQDRRSSIDGQTFSRGVSWINIPLTPNKTVHLYRQSFTHNNNVPNTSHLTSLPTLLPHPKTQNGLPTLSHHPKTQNGTLLGILRTDERILSLSRDISLARCLSNASDLLPVLKNFDMDLTYLKLPSIEVNVPLSLPTLPHHPKTQSGTLPGSLRIKRFLSRDISVGRCLSNVSDNFERNILSLLMIDEKDDAQNKTGLDDGTTITFSSN